MRVIALLLLLAFALVSPVAAAQGAIKPPFSKLFQPPTPLPKPSPPANPLKSAQIVPAPSREPAKVVCGMTLMPADASLDPHIIRRVPDAGVKFYLDADPRVPCDAAGRPR